MHDDPGGDMAAAAAHHLHLLSGPFVSAGERRIPVPEGSRRLVAYCALQREPVARRRAAADLWPECAEGRAAGNLRSALWRLRRADLDVLDGDQARVRVRDDVLVDLDEAEAWTQRLIDGRPLDDDLRILPWWSSALDLLPGWYDDWVLMARERLRHRTLMALERLAATLCAVGRTALAIDVAMLAVSQDLLAESAQRTLVEAHLADGNYVMAWRAYGRYRDHLATELGVVPSASLTALLEPARGAIPAPRASHDRGSSSPVRVPHTVADLLSVTHAPSPAAARRLS